MFHYRLASCYAKLGFIDTAFLCLHQYIDISQDDRCVIIDKNFDTLREDTIFHFYEWSLL